MAATVTVLNSGLNRVQFAPATAQADVASTFGVVSPQVNQPRLLQPVKTRKLLTWQRCGSLASERGTLEELEYPRL